jgi:hypothetical protein
MPQHGKGLYRQKKYIDGKLVHAGSFRVDVRTPFASCPRIAKLTGVFPGTPRAKERVSQIKEMLHDLVVSRDETTLLRIHRGELKLLDALHFWLQGRIALADSFQSEPLIARLEGYISSAVLRDTTKTRNRAIVAALMNKGLLQKDHTVRQIPEALRAIRRHYELSGNAAMFNNTRMMILAFLKKGLGYDNTSRIYLDVQAVEQLKLVRRRDHHPFLSPHDMLDLIARLRAKGSPAGQQYAHAVAFMCFHSLRPNEFTSGSFERDNATGHLRINGTKNPNAYRVVPMLNYFHGAPPKLGTLNATLTRLVPPTPVRCRDFRRTYSVWCEAAGIPRSRYQRYLGHAVTDVTAIYQQTRPTRETLDEDQQRLLEWLREEMARPRATRKPQWSPSAGAFVSKLLGG